MRTVQLIQFISASEYGYIPDPHDFYEVVDMEETYEYDDGDDYIEFDAISIMRPKYLSDGNKRMVKSYVVNNDDTSYNLLTIELDDDSQLFDRR